MSPIVAPPSPYPGGRRKVIWPSSAWPETPSAATPQTPSLPGSSVKVTVSPLSPGAPGLRTYIFFSSWPPLGTSPLWKLEALGKSSDWEEGCNCSKSWVIFPSWLFSLPCAYTHSLFKGAAGGLATTVILKLLLSLTLLCFIALVLIILIIRRERRKGRAWTIFVFTLNHAFSPSLIQQYVGLCAKLGVRH